MKLLALADLVSALVCPNCRGGELSAQQDSARCERCGTTYRDDSGVLSFLIPGHLDATNLGEIKGNTFPDSYVERMLEKEEWNPLLTEQMRWVVRIVDEMIPANRDRLYALGAGTGFDLRLLLRHRTFSQVFASDISPAATALIARALAGYPGELGLFASEFSRCPAPRGERNAGLVFQALHHAPDAHAALDALLEHNFDDLVIVEPLTNMVFGVLAKFDLVQRVEYTGTRPDWLDMRRITQIASRRAYRVVTRTWWEVPPYLAPPWLVSRPAAWRGVYRFFDSVSRTTNLIRLGSMAAIHFARS